MSTGNFYKENARHYYSLFGDIEDSADCSYIEDYVQYFKEDFIKKMEQYPYTTKIEKEFPKGDNRNYPIEYFASWSATRTLGDLPITTTLYAGIRSGYYEAANLDWMLRVFIDGSVETEDFTFVSDYNYYSQMNNGMKAIHAKNAARWHDKISEEMVNNMEKLFSVSSIVLDIRAAFSNGEVIYRRVC